MASHHVSNDLDSTHPDSLTSTPRSDYVDTSSMQPPPRVRFMCSFGGKILPRPHDNQLRYVGGDTRIVAVHRHTSFSSLLSKLSKLCGSSSITIKYQLPTEDLDALITVTADDDVENMMDEYDRLTHLGGHNKLARLRLFLFPLDHNNLHADHSRTSSISSLLDGSAKRESWFVDALNGGTQNGGGGPVLERGRSEVSSIVSEVPDYLFGLDNSEDTGKESTRMGVVKNRNNLMNNDNVSMSDPGSPAPVVSSPFCSTSSSLAPPDLPPVKTRPANPVQPVDQVVVSEKMISQQTGYPGSPMWHYPNPNVGPVPAVYYVPAGGHHVQVQPGSAPVQPVQIRAQFVQPYPVGQGQVPIGFPGVNQVYGAGVRQYEVPATQAMYYGARNVAVVPGSYPGMVVPAGEETQGLGPDMVPGRVSQGS